MKQFNNLDDAPPLYYALAVLRDNKWSDFLVVRRARLQSYYNGPQKFGSYDKANDALVMTVEFRDKVTCSGQELSDCRNAWKSLPPLLPQADLANAAADRAQAGDFARLAQDETPGHADEPTDRPDQA
jgi:hypothetical protein